MQINEIKETFSVRSINQSYVDFLADDFKKHGFQSAYPVSITDAGVLWDGNHRLAAAKAAGLDEIPHIIETPGNLRVAAHERNRVSTNALPETFVDHAEEIWSMLDSGMTQQRVADEIGWSLSKVKQYSRLDIISPLVWQTIVTEFQKNVTGIKDNDVSIKVTNVTEGLLRNILDLTETHQDKIISGLINGSIKNSQVKNKAKELKGRELFAEYAIENLISNDDKPTFFNDCFAGLYSTEEQIRKSVKHANDAYNEKNQIQVVHGDCLEVLPSVGQVDAIVTDPPYFITGESWDQFPSKEDFLSFSKQWISLACEKVKTTGRIYIFWSQEYMFDFPFDAIPDDFVFGNCLIWNYKNNIKPHNQKCYKKTYEPLFYFYGKDASKLNLPHGESWGKNINDYDVFTEAQPQTNFTDKKEHPTQKPLELMKQIISIGTEIGDTVLDCFAGSGTTGVACKTLKRKAILIEKDNDYVNTICRRL